MKTDDLYLRQCVSMCVFAEMTNDERRFPEVTVRSVSLTIIKQQRAFVLITEGFFSIYARRIKKKGREVGGGRIFWKRFFWTCRLRAVNSSARNDRVSLFIVDLLKSRSLYESREVSKDNLLEREDLSSSHRAFVLSIWEAYRVRPLLRGLNPSRENYTTVLTDLRNRRSREKGSSVVKIRFMSAT